MNENETALVLRSEQVLINATDKSLYSFYKRESMIKIREASTILAINRFFSLAESNDAMFIYRLTEKMPHLKKAFDSLKGKTELIVKLSEKARKNLECEEWHWVFAKDDSGLLPTLYNSAGHFAEQIRVGYKIIRPDMLNSLLGLIQKSNLDALTDKVIYLTNVVEQIAAGQYNDRVALYYGAKQLYIEAMSMNDPENRRIALLNAAKSADDAISVLQQTIIHDLNNLSAVKSGKSLNNKTKLIAKCFSRLNDSVQISVNVYAALGENRALLAAVTSYQCFVEQTLLSVPDNILDKRYIGCTLADIMHSCSEINGTDWRKIPKEIIEVCETIIRTELETIDILVEELDCHKLGDSENEV